MSALREDERFVIVSIATAFGGEWRCGENPPDAYLTTGTKVFAVEISTLAQPIKDNKGTHSRLSDDCTARAFLAAIKAKLCDDVPNYCTVSLHLSSPILRFHGTKIRLVDRIRSLLADSASLVSGHKVHINGNDIEIFFTQHNESHPAKVSGYISHRGSDPDVLTNVRLILDDRITTKTKKCGYLHAIEPLWLALFNDYWLAGVDTYRLAMSSLCVAHPFERILLVNGSGAVDQIYPFTAMRKAS